MKFVKIKQINKTETEPIYHLTIEKNHNFFGNKLCLHNCDYYSNIKNDGNIGLAIKNTGDSLKEFKKGEGIAQGTFYKYLVSDNGNTNDERVGGMGSTNNKV